eukprot:655143-Lingulodinium_polyedra.AAC.1
MRAAVSVVRVERAGVRCAAADGRCNALNSTRAAPKQHPNITEAAPEQHASSAQAAPINTHPVVPIL